ncbi:ABC transporter permease [Paenibacillus thermotolerans]|uniref:ABC transporter permease n=1 Tax=Paenibacillus thermotolerans TaxID=3027807 RepID=UPI002367A20E|nr:MULTISPECIES: ABC transporter permease [unclassified Paenibacillus]
MKIGMIAYYTFLRNVRDLKAILAFTLMPMVMILILGTALDSDFTPKTIEPAKVAYLNEDKGDLGTAFDTFMQSETVASLLQAEPVSDADEGMKAVKSGEFEAFFYLRNALSDRLHSGEEARIEWYTQYEASLVAPVLDSFVRTANLSNTLPAAGREPPGPKDSEKRSIHEVRVVTEGKIPRGIDYYSIATLFQTLLFGSLFGIFAVTKDLGNHTNSRLLAAPIRSSHVTLGKLIGSGTTLYAISLLILLVSKYVYQANWKGGILLAIVVLFFFSVLSVGLGMIVAHLTKSTLISALSLFFLTFVMTLVSGGFSPMDGKWMELLSRYTPNHYAHTVLFTKIYEGAVSYTSLLGLAVYTGFVVLLTFAAGRRRVA